MPKSKSLLIIECDSKKLSSQSLEMADEIRNLSKIFSPQSNIETIKTSTESNLANQFAELSLRFSRFTVMVIVGHSNAKGICLTTDRFASWVVLSKWILPFKPQKIVLIACQSGHKEAAKDIFACNPNLKEIYAPPLNTSKSKSEVVKLLMPYLLNAKSVKDEVVLAGQVINTILTGGIFFRWQRKDFKK